MNNNISRINYAALDFTAKHLHCLRKDETDEALFFAYWNLHYNQYPGIMGTDVFEIVQRIMAMCLDS